MTNSERTTRLNIIAAAAMKTERIPRHRLVDTTAPPSPPAAMPAPAQYPDATGTDPNPSPADGTDHPPAPAHSDQNPDAPHPGPDPDVSRLDRSQNPDAHPDERLGATHPIRKPGATEADQAPETTPAEPGPDTGPDPHGVPADHGSDSPTRPGPAAADEPAAVENDVVAIVDRSNAPQRRSRWGVGSIGTGSGDPGEDPSTTNLGPMTERFLGQDQPPAGPPARPRFEFRPPPSAVCAPRPPFLTVASLLWLAAAGILLVAVVLPLVGVGDLWADISALVNRDFPNETAATRDRAVAAVTGALVGGGVLLALGEAAAAAAMRRGRSAARIVLALLLILAAVHAVLTITVAPAITAALLGVATALGLGGAVLMFLPGTTEWLHRPRR